MIRLTTFLAIAIGIGAEHAVAQELPRNWYTVFLAAGASGIETGKLREQLAANGYPGFESRPRGINIGAYRLLSSGLMLGGEWHVIDIGEKDYASHDVGLDAGYATLGVGYAMELSRRARIYPRLGLGIGGMGLWFKDNAGNDDAIPFDTALADPSAEARFTTFSQGSMAVDLGGGAELLLGNRGGPLVGLRLGYIATPFDQGWTRHGRELSGAPKATVAGPYARLMLGWRFRK